MSTKQSIRNAVNPIVDRLAEEVGANPRKALAIIAVLAVAFLIAVAV